MKKFGFILALIFVVGFSNNVLAQEDNKKKDGIFRISMGLDHFNTSGDSKIDNIIGEGDFVISTEFGRGNLFRKVFIIQAGAHDFWGDLFSGGFQLETGFSFLRVGPGLILNRKQFHTYNNRDPYFGELLKTDNEWNLNAFLDTTLNLGDSGGGFYVKYKVGPTIWSSRGYAKSYYLIAFGIYAQY